MPWWFSLWVTIAAAPAMPGRQPHPDVPKRLKLIPCLIEGAQDGRAPDATLAYGAFAPFNANRAAWNPDGSRVLLNTADLLAVSDVKTGKTLVRLQAGLEQNVDHPSCPGTAGFSADGTLIFASDFVGAALFDAATGKPLRFVNHPVRVVGMFDNLKLSPNRLVAVGPRGAVLAFGDEKRPEVVVLVDGTTEATLHEAKLGTAITAVAFSADGTLLAALGTERGDKVPLDILTVASGAVLRHLEVAISGTISPVHEVTFDPAGSRLRLRVGFSAVFVDASTGAESGRQTVQGGGALSPAADRLMQSGGVLVDAATGARVPPSRWNDRGLAALAVAADGTLAYAGIEEDSGLGVLWLPEGLEQRLPLSTDRDTRLAFSADGKVLYANDRKRVLHRFVRSGRSFAPGSEKSIGDPLDTVRELVPSPDGATVALWVTRQRVGEVIVLLDGQTLVERRKIETAQQPRFAGSAGVFAYNSLAGSKALVVEQASTREVVARLPVMHAFSLSADGKHVVGAAVDRDQIVFLRRRVSDGLIEARGPTHPFMNLAVPSPQGALGVVRIPMRPSKLLSPDVGTDLGELTAYWNQLFAFSPDERSLYAVGLDRTIARWDVKAAPQAIVADAISPTDLAAQIAKQQPEFDRCFEKHPRTTGKRRKVSGLIWVGKTGAVTSVDAGSFKGQPVGDCLDDVLFKLKLPATRAGADHVRFEITESR